MFLPTGVINCDRNMRQGEILSTNTIGSGMVKRQPKTWWRTRNAFCCQFFTAPTLRVRMATD